jgi:murein L,D-transpeptidase YafK
MPIRRLLAAALLLPISIGLSGAHRDEPEAGATAVLEQGLAAIVRTPPAAADALYREALGRLEARLQRYPQDHEASLLKALIQFKGGDRPAALDELARLTLRAPRFHLAHLVRGDLLLSRAQAVTDIGSAPLLAALGEEEELRLLRAEAEARLSAYLDTLPQGRLPRALAWLDESVPTALVVDKAANRLYVYVRGADGMPELVQDFYVSTGRADGNKLVTGDLRTPEGVYFVTSHIPDESLPDKYGVGAFPLNYPNAYDARQGKTGYGIWLHGTETAYYSRPPLDSEGCVVLPNPDLLTAARYVTPGVTPVVIADRVAWMDASEWLAQRRELLAAVEAWRGDWEGLDVGRYLSHYAGDFRSGRHNRAGWGDYKRRVAAGKQYQRIQLTRLSAFVYPQRAGGSREMAVVDFRQHYDSNNFSSEMDKRLYLVREEGAWRILHEGGR